MKRIISLFAKLHLCVFAVLAASGIASPARATRPLVFLSPVTDQSTPAGFSVDPDYQNLFRPGSPWQNARSHVNAFEVTNHYVFTQDEGVLRMMFSYLEEHHITLAVVFGLVPGCGKGPNGRGIEGTTSGQYNLGVAKRLKRLGAKLGYIIVDEPLTFGHYAAAENACRYPIDQLATAFRSEAQKIRSVYPNTPIIEEEADSGIGTPQELGLWLDALRREMGATAPISIRFDIQWSSPRKPWRQIAPPLVEAVVRHGYRYGIIYDGDPGDATAEAWIRSAQHHVNEWEAVIPYAPDHVAIKSWHREPERVLPETSPTTLPYLVNWYVQHASGNRLH